MDTAYMPLRQILDELLRQLGAELVDDAAGVRSRIHECSIEMPLELDVSRDAAGALRIGTTPPMYYVDTTFRPSFHRISFTAVME